METLSSEQMKRFGVKFEDMINKTEEPLSQQDTIEMIERLFHRIEAIEARLNPLQTGQNI